MTGSDISANDEKVDWQTVRMAHRQTRDRHIGKRSRNHKHNLGNIRFSYRKSLVLCRRNKEIKACEFDYIV